MTLKKIIAVLTVLYFSGNVNSQERNISQRGLAITVYNHNNNDAKATTKSKEVYLNESWMTGYIQFYSGKKMDCKQFNYIHNKGFLVINSLNNDSSTLIQGYTVKKFVNMNYGNVEKSFVNGKEYGHDIYPSVFCELLVDGEMKLLKVPELITLNPNYNAITNSGSKESKMFLKYKFYCFSENKLVEIERSKKKLLGLFKTHFDEIKKYVKSNKLSPKKENDLIAVFKYYNSL